MNDLVLCSGVTKVYDAVKALDGVELKLSSGRIVGLLGPNGSGKTTLIKILAGLLCPTAGAAQIDGKPIGTQTKAVVSYLPDRMYYAGWMKTRDLIDLFADFCADFRAESVPKRCARRWASA